MAVGAGIICVIGILSFPRISRWYRVREAEQLLEHPLPEVSDPAHLRPSPSPSPSLEVNLPVPFTVQAPHGNWDLPYQEACEEAAALMAIRYAFGNPILSPDDADAAILDLVRTNAEILRLPFDQTAEEVMRLIHEIDDRIGVRLLHDPTIEALQRELSSGNVVLVPAAGRKLGNPFFRRPGPLYHMLVLRGYTEDGYFITNDPGTKRGEEYLYPFARIMEANGDWASGGPDMSRKVVIVVAPFAQGQP